MLFKITQINEENTELLAHLADDVFDERINFERVAALVKELQKAC